MRKLFLLCIIRFMENNLCREYSRLSHIRETIADDEARVEGYRRELMGLEVVR